MRIDCVLRCAAWLLMCAVPLAAQQSEKERMPKKGDVITIKGCLRGSAVESAYVLAIGDQEGDEHAANHVPTLTYRLQGEKSLLKDLKQKHDRMVVEIKGILRSELSRGALGTDVGRTRITIGVDPRTARGAEQPLPVLEAKSFEGSTVSCGK